MRVALIDPSLFTAQYDRELAAGLSRSGHQVTLHGRRPRPSDGNLGDLHLAASFYRVAETRSVAALPSALRLAVKSGDHALSMLRLLRRMRQTRPDIIHFQWLPVPWLDSLFIDSLRRVAPTVLTVHDTNPFNGDPTSRLQTFGSQKSLACFDSLIVHTKQGFERLVARGLMRDRIALVPHGAGPPVADQWAPGALEPTTFVMFGKLKSYKGIDLLIEAFSRMSPQLRSRSRMRIVGQPYMDLAPLHALAERAGVADQLEIEPRFVPDEEIGGLFGPSTVAVLPYREIEASGVLPLVMALGRPVVASKLGSCAELIVDGVHGHLIDPGDVCALSAALAHLVEDREFAARCATAVRKAAANAPTWDEVAERTAGVYRTLRAPDRIN